MDKKLVMEEEIYGVTYFREYLRRSVARVGARRRRRFDLSTMNHQLPPSKIEMDEED